MKQLGLALAVAGIAYGDITIDVSILVAAGDPVFLLGVIVAIIAMDIKDVYRK